MKAPRLEFQDPIGAHRNAGIPVSGVTWSGETFRDEDIAGVVFNDCVLERVRLERMNMRQTMFLNCRFDDCVVHDCQLVSAGWVDCHGAGLRISGGEFAETLFSQCNLSRLDLDQGGRQNTLSESTFGHVAFNGAGCEQVIFTITGCTIDSLAAENAAWRQSSFIAVDLGSWALNRARMDKCCFIRATGNGTDLSKVRFEACNLYQSELRGARLREAPGSIFAECDLADADFIEADLKGSLFAKSAAPRARFDRAHLDGALFPKAVLHGASFAGATARQSVWQDADLTGADLASMDAFRSTFRNAVLRDAEVGNTRFVEADLHGVEETLAGADLRGSRGTVQWRAEREAEVRDRAPSSPRG